MEKIARKGQCLCGDIVFTATGDPLWIAHCHCRSCRRNTGSVAATFTGYRPDQVLFKPDNRRFFASSEGVSRGFCARCGTPVSYTSTRWPDELHLYLGLFDQPDSLVPQEHVHFAEKVSWLELDTALPYHLRTSG
ncbi:MAG: GFA family protein [Gammaproteobacteria bacterium]|nr:GFA family protein [Gammaproteobacteria bacterium]